MFGNKKKQINNSANKFDKLVTGLIIGGALASVVGLSKTKKGKEVTKNVKANSGGFFKKGLGIFGKGIVGILKIFGSKK